MKTIKNVFARPQAGSRPQFSLDALVDTLSDAQKQLNNPLSVNVSIESFDRLSSEQTASLQDLYGTLESTLNELGFEDYNSVRGADAGRIHSNQIAAGTLINLAHQDEKRYKDALKTSAIPVQSSNPNVISASPVMAGPFGTIPVMTEGRGLENYNEKSNRDFRVISVAYNLAAARQDAFGEALYPTVVVNPTEGGVTQNLTYAAVMKDVFHQSTGAVFDTEEVNMVEAYRDPSILADESTALFPVVDAQGANLDVFVDAADVAPRTVDTGRGGSVETAPLVIGKQLDLLGVSNRSQLVAANVLDISDTIDPALRLKTIYVKSGGLEPIVLAFQVDRMPTAVFQPALVGDSRQANLAFNTEDLVINGDTTAIDGSKNAALNTLTAAGWTIRLGLGVSGSVSLSKGTTVAHATPPSFEKVIATDGSLLALDDAAVAAFLADLGGLTVIGYELEARFTNTNRRERGKLVQTRTMQFRYAIPMHAPITLPMSTMDQDGPGAVVKTLTVSTNIRNSNNAVTRLLNYVSQLKAVTGQGYDRPKFGAVEGALSVMIRPTYSYARLDLETGIDSVRSQDRYDDACSAILNTIVSMLYPAYRESNIEAAFQAITGNADEKPKFIIATDKEIANYLMRRGDDRTLGSQLKYDIVSTNNSKFDGKIIVVPTRENPSENDILNFGQFYYVPTLVADLPISRNGKVDREIAAVPFNLHVNNIPFALEIDVVGLDKVMATSVFNQAGGIQNP